MPFRRIVDAWLRANCQRMNIVPADPRLTIAAGTPVGCFRPQAGPMVRGTGMKAP